MSKKLSLVGVLICVLIFVGSAAAQTPAVVTTFPTADAENVAYDAVIYVDFNVGMNPTTIDESSMIVTGSLTGVHDGTYAYSPILRRVYFEATDEFGLGEQVSVQLTTAVTSIGGLPLSQDYTWSFTIAQPGVSQLRPRDGGEDIFVDNVISVQFNGNIDPNTLTGETFLVSGSLTGTHTGAIKYTANDRTAVFTPDTPFGLAEDVTATLTTSVMSTEGVPFPSNFSWTFTTAAPAVVSVSPANGIPGISVDTMLQITFNGGMDAASFADAVTVSGDKTGEHTLTLNYDDGSRTLTVVPDVPFGLSERITAIVSTVATSAESQPLATQFLWTFNTAIPKVIATSPDSGAMNVANGTSIQATFNGAMDAATFSDATIQVTGALTHSHTGTATYDEATRTVTFDPTEDFVVGEVVTVRMTGSIKSAEGAKLDPAYTMTFDTESPEIISVTPAQGALNVAANSAITMTFNIDMAPPTFDDSASFRVDERATGMLEGSITYDEASRTATFVPKRDFQVGDVITAMATSSLKSLGGVPLMHGYNWQFTVAVTSGSGSFAGQTTLSTGSFPRSIATGDFDYDGNLDLITANSESDNVWIFWGNGTGNYSSSKIAAVGAIPCQVIVGDFNRDGKTDFATANYQANSISYGQHNKSDLTPRAFENSSTKMAGDGPRGLAGADLNGDGLLDIISANSYSNDISVFMNTGSKGAAGEVFDSAIAYKVGTSPRKVVAVDLDGDFDVDLATANAFSNDVTVLFNHGDGTFDTDTGAVYLAVGDHPYSLAAVDIDADGDFDLVTTDAWDDQVTVLINGGHGNFVSSTSYAVDQFPRAVTAADADFDGNGLLDIATVNADDNTMSLLLNEGGGQLASQVTYAVGRYPFGICAVDIDYDGDLDILTANAADNNITVLYNGGTTTDVEGGSNPTLPVAYGLQQNYPNPFNPSTTIEYSLARPGEVTFEVFNALGQRVLDLQLGPQTTGQHRVTWDGHDRDGHNLASGVYFYRITSGDFSQTKKMVLMK